MNRSLIAKILLSQKEEARDRQIHPFVERLVDLADYILEPEITVISGVRRCGKSSLMERLLLKPEYFENAIYINFEDPQLLDFKANDFQGVYENWIEKHDRNAPRLALFDEIQSVHGWERWMNFFAKQKQFKVFVTGSNSTMLSSELGTHLTGRHRQITLYPLSFYEIARHGNLVSSGRVDVLSTEKSAELAKLTLAYLKFGGFPRSWLSSSTSILSDYYQHILQRDILKRKKLRNSLALEKLGAAVMSEIGRKINKSRIAHSIGLKDADTVEKYLKYFQECYLGFEVRKFDNSIRKQLRSQSKFYAIDAALARRIGNPTDGKEGYYLENLVLCELMRRGAKVYYGEIQNQSEIDFVVEGVEGERHLFQVAWSVEDKQTFEREMAGFKHFTHSHKNLRIDQKFLITMMPCPYEYPSDINVMPFYQWALKM